MELRLDVLLDVLREQAADVLARIDVDPLLVKRESGGLVLANAGQELYTPRAEHQLFAKGIVYRREPYRVVSLPLVKIYNLGERDVTVADLARLAEEPDVRLRFLRKFDGSLVQVFREDGRVWFTTRGMIEGARGPRGEDADLPGNSFDFLGAARRLAEERYPRLLTDEALLDGRTLIFELIHPQARKVTGYGERADLVLLAAFDRRTFRYAPHPEVQALGAAHGLTTVDALSPRGTTIAAQIDDLLASLAGTDEEGSVLTFERGGAVVYRVKVKSPDYLRLLRVMSFCTYERTVEMLEADPSLRSWERFEAFLRDQGRDRVPEEVLGFYRQHQDRYLAYLADCARLRQWAEQTCRALEARLGGRAGRDPAAYRREFAALAVRCAYPALLFQVLDGKLDVDRARRSFRTPEEARAAVAALVP